MAGIDGEWETVAQSPMGEQRNAMTLATQADGSFSGTSSGPMGSAEVVDGKVDGDQVSWKIKMTAPFPMTLSVTGTLSGDTMEGQVDTGSFGKFPIKGSRKG